MQLWLNNQNIYKLFVYLFHWITQSVESRRIIANENIIKLFCAFSYFPNQFLRIFFAN